MPPAAPDVLVLGEVLVEVSTTVPFADGVPARLGFSGDALNVAAAAAAAGAATALVARVPDDALGDALVARVAALGVDVTHVLRVPGQHGVYVTHADPDGRREFGYARAGSAGSALAPGDLPPDALAGAGVVVASGVLGALSPAAADAVRHAARRARRFVYDPNHRPRLATAAAAGRLLREVAPSAEVVTPSWPGETSALLGLPADLPPDRAARAVSALGPRSVVLTCGPAGAVVIDGADGGDVTVVPAVPAPRVVDQTGAGDSLTGTLAGRLALGDRLVDAVRLAAAAAALSVGGQGGTGCVPSLDETRRALDAVTAKELS